MADVILDEWLHTPLSDITLETPVHIQQYLDESRLDVERTKNHMEAYPRVLTPQEVNDRTIKQTIEKRIFNIKSFFYTKGDRLGAGGFGDVYKLARRRIETVDDSVIKIQLRENTDMGQDHKIPKEVEFLRMLSNLTFCPEYNDEYRQAAQQYIVMERIKGLTLDDLTLEKHNDMEHREVQPWAFDMISQLFGAIDYLAQLEIHHGDLKGSNVMVEEITNRLVLVDFGFMYQGNHTPDPRNATLIFNPPEVIPKDLTTRRADHTRFGRVSHEGVDVWSMGLLMFCVLHGNYPYLYGRHDWPDPIHSNEVLKIHVDLGLFADLIEGTLDKYANRRWNMRAIYNWIERTKHQVSDQPHKVPFARPGESMVPFERPAPRSAYDTLPDLRPVITPIASPSTTSPMITANTSSSGATTVYVTPNINGLSSMSYPSTHGFTPIASPSSTSPNITNNTSSSGATTVFVTPNISGLSSTLYPSTQGSSQVTSGARFRNNYDSDLTSEPHVWINTATPAILSTPENIGPDRPGGGEQMYRQPGTRLHPIEISSSDTTPATDDGAVTQDSPPNPFADIPSLRMNKRKRRKPNTPVLESMSFGKDLNDGRRQRKVYPPSRHLAQCAPVAIYQTLIPEDQEEDKYPLFYDHPTEDDNLPRRRLTARYRRVDNRAELEKLELLRQFHRQYHNQHTQTYRDYEDQPSSEMVQFDGLYGTGNANDNMGYYPKARQFNKRLCVCVFIIMFVITVLAGIGGLIYYSVK